VSGDGGEGEEGYRLVWKPTMSSADAERWAAGSAYPAVVFHVTTTETARAIRRLGFDLGYRAGGRAWGNGVYAATDRATCDWYLEQLGRHGVALALRVRVAHLLSMRVRPLSRLSPLRQALAAIPGGVGRFVEFGLSPVDPETAFTHVVLEAGYDAIRIREDRFTRTVGGNQLVVFDPKRIVVIDDERY
jgi:hypothetical protein